MCRECHSRAAELQLWSGVDRPVRARRAASPDGPLTVITCGRGLERAEGLRLTDTGKPLIGSRGERVRGVRRGWVASEGRLVLPLT